MPNLSYIHAENYVYIPIYHGMMSVAGWDLGCDGLKCDFLTALIPFNTQKGYQKASKSPINSSNKNSIGLNDEQIS